MNDQWDGIYVVFAFRQKPAAQPRRVRWKKALVGRLDSRGRVRDVTGFDQFGAARAFARRINERGALGVAYED